MKQITQSLCIFILLLVACKGIYAEDGVLVVHVADPKGKPVSGVILSTMGDGSTGAPTDGAGKTRIKLAAQNKPNNDVALQIVKTTSSQELVFISPWDGHVRVPPFENESQNFVSIVLIERGDRAWLEYDVVTTSMAAKINAANAGNISDKGNAEEQRKANLTEVARAYGLTPEEADRAIRAFGKKATDPYQLGQVALYERNYPEAEKQLSKSVEERERSFEKAKGDLVDAQYFLGQTFEQQAKYREAVSTYQKAANLRPDDSKILTSLAGVLDTTGNEERAEELLKQALAIDEKNFGPDDPRLSTRTWNLGAFYANHKKYELCEQFFKRTINLLEKNFGPDEAELAYHLNNLAMLYMTRQKYSEAEPLLKRALGIQEKVLGPSHPALAYSLNTMGAFYLGQGKDAEAEPLLKRSLEIILNKIRTSTDEKEPATALVNNFITGAGYLGHLYIKQKKYGEAEKYLKTRLALSEKLKGELNPQIVKDIDDVADLYERQKKYDEAEKLYKRSLAIMENALGTDHPHLDKAIYNLASLYEEQNLYAQAEAQFKRVVKLYEKTQKPLELVVTIINSADFYVRQKKYAEAEPLFSRALELIQTSGVPEYPNTAAVLTKLASLHIRQQKYKETEALFQRVLTIIDKAQNPDIVDLVYALDNLADLYTDQKRFAEAEPLYKRMLSALETSQSGDDPNVAVVAFKLATVYREEAKYTESETSYKRAITIWEKKFGPDYPAIAEALESYATLLRKTNREAEATEAELRAEAIKAKQGAAKP